MKADGSDSKEKRSGKDNSDLEHPSDSSGTGEPPLQEGGTSQMDDKFGPAPDGGIRAWLVAAGGACVFFCCLGFANSFGTFAQYYATHQLPHRSPDDIAWIGSLNGYLQMAMGLLGGPAFDRYGSKVVRIAAVLYIASMMLLSLCKEYWHFMLVQAVLMGTLQGFIQIPAFAAVSHYFDKKRAAALGIVVAGSSLGGVVIPIAVARMLNASSLGYGWTVRVVGFLIMPILLFASAVLVPRLPPRSTSFWLGAAMRDARFLLVVSAFFFASIGMFVPLFYLPTYAVTRGVETTMAGYLLAILNATSTFGRVIPGVLADKYGRLNALVMGCIGTGIIVFCFSLLQTEAGLIVYAIFVGFFSGTITSAGSAAISICCPDPRNMGTYMGMGLALGSLGLLIGPPIGGALVRTYGGYFEFSMFGGATCIFGGLVALYCKFFTPQGILGKA
ncbi:MFS general substrate transporter [Apiospora kogelbergensis]|uniref:MFS general substrate transporter n=1 Tax=Apiospora kogelbergensis TaxID=1337665 RepID=UPI003131AF5E